MLTQVYRPRTFSELRGQVLPRRILSSISKSPENAPRSIICSGERGLGKTSICRIFARALNCRKHSGDCCNECETCREALTGSSSLYSELDSSIVGNVEAMRGLRDTFAFSVQRGYKVLVLDETHLCSPQAQSAMLTVFEEAPKGVFFLMATTNAERLLDTIVSRSLVLNLEPLQDVELIENLKSIASKENMTLADSTYEFVARRVRGHVRDSLQQLEMIKLIGEEAYVKEIHPLDVLFDRLFDHYEKRNPTGAKETLIKIMSNPVLYIEQDFEGFIRKVADLCFLEGKGHRRSKDLVSFYLKNHRYLKSSSDWYLFLSSVAALYEEPTTSTMVNRFKK